jgi:hypothetical protein
MPEDATRELVLFEEGGFDLNTFHHRDHLRIGFEMLRQYPFTEAANRFASGIRAMAFKAGRPHVYHETITVAFLTLIAERMEKAEDQDFRAFEHANPDLFEKAILNRWYSAGRLGSEIARRRFVLPEPYEESRMSEMRWLGFYRWLFVGFVSLSSTQTIFEARSMVGHASIHHVVLGAAEITGAVLFAFRRAQLIGAGILFLVFGFGTFLATMLGELPVRFFFYAGTVAFIVLMDRRMAVDPAG